MNKKEDHTWTTNVYSPEGNNRFGVHQPKRLEDMHDDDRSIQEAVTRANKMRKSGPRTGYNVGS